MELGGAESVLPHGLKRWRAPVGPKWLRAAGYWLLALIIPFALIGEVFSPDAPRTPEAGPHIGSTARMVRQFVDTPPAPAEEADAAAEDRQPATSMPAQTVAPVASDWVENIESVSAPASDGSAAIPLRTPDEADAIPRPPSAQGGSTARRASRNAPQAPAAVSRNDRATPRPADTAARPRISDGLSAPAGIPRTQEDALPPRAAESRPALSAASDLATPEAGPRDDLGEARRRASSDPTFPDAARGQLSPRREPLPTVSADPVSRLTAPVTTGTRVAIHVPVGTEPTFAQAVTRFIVNDGLDVFAVRNFRFGLDSPNIRFFHASDRAVAERVARVLTAYGLPAEARDFTHFRPPPEPGLIEVWIAPPRR